MADVLTKTQEGLLVALAAQPLISSAAELGWRVQPKLGRIGATSALRALERRGLAHRIAPRDQWATAKWGITKLGRERVKELADAA